MQWTDRRKKHNAFASPTLSGGKKDTKIVSASKIHKKIVLCQHFAWTQAAYSAPPNPLAGFNGRKMEGRERG